MVDQDDDIEGEKLSQINGKGFSRKRGKLSQLMVFVNGVILTMTAFITLVIFLDQVKDARQKTFSDMLAFDLEKGFSSMQQEILTLGMAEQNSLSKYYTAEHFNAVMRAEKRQNNQWGVRFTYGEQFSVPDKNVFTTARNSLVNKEKAFVKVESFENTYAVRKLSDNVIFIGELKPLAFAKIFKGEKYNIVRRIRIYDQANAGRVFEFANNSLDDVPLSDTERHMQSVDISDTVMNIEVDIIKDPYFIFIEKIPYLLLLFGMTLTIIGTLYVRNNQKQAHQLELMNNALEDKNSALQGKMEESQTLYKQISRQEKEYVAVLNAIQDILFEVDSFGRIKFLNARWTDITGMDIDDVQDKNLFNFFDDKEIEKLRLMFQSFLKNKESKSYTTLIHKQEGGYHPVEVSFSMIHKDQDGEDRIVGIIKDIQEQSRAEKALMEAEKKYKTIVENAAGGIYQVTPDGYVVSANPSLAQILGYENMDSLTHQSFNLRNVYVSDDDVKNYDRAMNVDGFIRNHEVQVRRTNGEVIWINENARAVHDVDGSIKYYEGSIEDITIRKQSEIDLMEAKLNSDLASRAKSEFLANMSHELRTPLNSIIGFSEIIKGEALGEIAHKPYVDYAKDIYTSGTRLLTVINEILGISKIEAGDRQLNESVVDLSTVTQTCKDLLAAKIESNNIDVTIKFDEGLPRIVAEEMAFKQMIMNLLSNAIKFTPEGGKVTITYDYNDGDDLRLSMTDTGVGIDENDIPKALSPFGQLDNALSRSNTGTGLGLTLVDSLIRLHGGRLEMISQKGIGTTVTLVVPAKRVAVKKQSDKNAQGANVASLTDYKKQS